MLAPPLTPYPSPPRGEGRNRLPYASSGRFQASSRLLRVDSGEMRHQRRFDLAAAALQERLSGFLVQSRHLTNDAVRAYSQLEIGCPQVDHQIAVRLPETEPCTG